MKKYIIGKNILQLESDKNNLIVKNISNNIIKIMPNSDLPKSETDIENILILLETI